MANKNLRVKEICKQKGMTLAQLAEKMGIQANSLSVALVRGTMNINTLERMADALEVEIPELFEVYSASSIGVTSVCPHCGEPIKVAIAITK